MCGAAPKTYTLFSKREEASKPCAETMLGAPRLPRLHHERVLLALVRLDLLRGPLLHLLLHLLRREPLLLLLNCLLLLQLLLLLLLH